MSSAQRTNRTPTPWSWLVIAALSLVGVGPAGAQDLSQDPVMSAMQEELTRASADLRLGEHPPPWRVSLRVDETLDSASAAASFGALVGANRQQAPGRRLQVDVRVGSPESDNTHFDASFGGRSGLSRVWNGRASLPAGDDVPALRRAIWLAIDGEYKTALEMIARKRSLLEGRLDADRLPDWVPAESPATIRRSPLRFDGDPGPVLTALARDASAVCRDVPVLLRCDAQVRASHGRTRYLDSTGTRAVWDNLKAVVVVRLAAQAPDGIPLVDELRWTAEVAGDLPRAEILDAVAVRARALAELRDAATAERYEGPVLFEGAAAARVVARTFAPQLVAARKPLKDPQAYSSDNTVESPLQERLGRRVLPDFLSVSERPGLLEHHGQPLLPKPPIDVQGTPVRDVVLIEGGSLRALLGGRAPARGLEGSTGNARDQGVGARRLVMTSKRGKGEAALRKALLRQVAAEGLDYGVVVTRLAPVGSISPSTPRFGVPSGPTPLGVPDVLEAYALYLDGRIEPLRAAQIPSVSTDAFRRILAAGRVGHLVHDNVTRPGAYGGASDGDVIAPSLLFEELRVQAPEGPLPRPVVVGPPGFAGSP